jgi:hypothetical protein
MQEVKFKLGDLLEFCTEKQQLRSHDDLIYEGYGMVVSIEPGEHIDEMVYTVDIYKGTESSIKANADISGCKFKFYETQIHHDMRLLNAGTKNKTRDR